MPPPEPVEEAARGLFSIDAHIAFVDALALGLFRRCADPMALARTQVLLPNRRAARALTEAFVRLSGGGVLLPRMTPVGDLGDDGFERFAAGDAPLAPAVPPLLRRLELARLVRAMPGNAAGAGSRSAVEALRLGDQLGATLDALLAEEVAPERLRAVVEGQELAAHWQATLRFLEVVISAWPPVRDAMAGTGSADGGTRIAALIDALVARWARQAPAGLVVAAGITGSSPPLVRLLAGVLTLPRGILVLPGLDRDLTPAGAARWDALGVAAEAHPQFAMQALLARLGHARDEVRDWGVVTDHDGPAARTAAVMAAMAPAAATDGWRESAIGSGDQAWAGVSAIEAATPAEEAQIIALALREALTIPGKRAILVTPDRGLARRVAAHCRRWGIGVDDSAGVPLRLTPPGALALALVEALAQGFSPVALLAVLKHPLVASSEASAANAASTRAPWLAAVRRLDLGLRGVRPPPGLDLVGEQVERWLEDRASELRRAGADAAAIAAARARDAELLAWWHTAATALEPLSALAERGETTLPRLAAALRVAGDALCGDRLWSGVDGRALARLIEALEADGDVFGAFVIDDAPALVAALLSDVPVRPPYGGHPRLAILGPLEAQLQHADLMILAGLNEGVWPQKSAPDPWLAPAIRRALGLPGLAREIGVAAHDFTSGMGAREVLLTRARRDAAAPLVPSRFWLRIEAFTGGLRRDDRLLTLARRIDGAGAATAVAPPRPCPPLAKRPRIVSVTEIDTLVADPFAFYARNLLRLRPLDPLDQDPTAATRGNRMHEVMERWIGGGGGSLELLARFTEEMLAAEGRSFPLLRALWAPRARRALAWAGEQVHAREAEGWHAVAAEAAGSLVLANGVTLKGRADRIDRAADGHLAVVDYKTGRAPTARQVKEGQASQLGLLMAMASMGVLRPRGGEAVPPGQAAEIAYWRLGGGTRCGEIIEPLTKKPPMAAADHVADVLALATQVTDWQLLAETPFESKRNPGLSWGDYDHLARVAEWLDRPARTRS